MDNILILYYAVVLQTLLERCHHLLLEDAVDGTDNVTSRNAKHVDENSGWPRAGHSGHKQMLYHKIAMLGQSAKHSLTKSTLPLDGEESKREDDNLAT